MGIKITDLPITHISGSTISPRDLNTNLNFLAEQIDNVHAKRFCHFDVSIPFHFDCQTPYTDLTDTEVKTYRITPTTDFVITSAELRWYGEADGTNSASIFISSSQDTTVNNEILSVIPGSTPSSKTSKTNLDLIRLRKGLEYHIYLTSSVPFSSSATWLNLRMRSDRFNVSGSDEANSYEPRRFSSGDSDLAAATYNAEITKVSQSVGSLTSNTSVSRISLLVAHNLVSGSNKSFYLPRVDSDVDRNLIDSTTAYFVYDDSPPASNIIYTINYLDQTGSVVVTETAQIKSSGLNGLESTSISTDINLSAVGASVENEADDWELELQVDTSGYTIQKAYAWVYYK